MARRTCVYDHPHPDGVRSEGLKSHGLAQEALADKAGLHRTCVSSLERGHRNVRLDNIHALASALGVPPSELLAHGDSR